MLQNNELTMTEQIRRLTTSDWRTKWLSQIPTHEELGALKCPFPIESLEQRDCIPRTYTTNVQHLQTGQDGAPWTGYYTTYKGAKLTVSNCYGVWFEIERRDNIWAAIQPARVSLNLQGNALDGINTGELITSGEPLPESWTPSHAPSRASIHTAPEGDEPMRIPAGRSTETERQPPRRPRGTGDDPFGVNDFKSESSINKDTNICLEGIPPKQFDGDRAKTLSFLTQFKWFILMNWQAMIAQDPYMKAAFFLSLMDGPKVEGWTQWTYDWLDQVEANSSLLPFKMNAWQALEANFKQSFVDYAEHEWAQDELRKLKMKDSNVDEYIASFQLLGHQAGMNLDDPLALWLFAQGLPKSLVDSCIDIDSPENFEQWANAAQCHHQNYLKKLAVHQDYALPRPQNNSS
jgi:hypothetical protein